MKKSILVLLVGLAGLAGVSCKKEGCTDSSAVNFDSKAKQNCCCEYEGSAVLWYGKAAADALAADDAVTLQYYVNGSLVGSSAANVYFTGAPDCGQSGSMTIKQNLGSEKSKTFIYKVVDQDGFTHWEGSGTLSGNTCQTIELKL